MSATRRARVVRASALLIGLTGVSHVLGFARDAVIAAVFGVGAALDAYLVAQGVMNLVLGLIAGAMAKAVVPPVARAEDTGDLTGARRTVRVVVTVTVTVLVAGSAVMYVAADLVVGVLAPGFDAATAGEAQRLARIVLVATVFVAGTNVLAGACQAYGRFFWSGFQGVPFNLVMIAAAALFGARFGVTALAVGFVAASAARFVTQLPAVRRIGLGLWPSFAVRDRGFRDVVALVPPLLVGSAVGNVNTLVDRAVASAQEVGAISALNFGWRIVNLAEALLVATVAAALFPAFSALGSPERRDELRRMTGRAVGVLLVLIGPVVAMLAVAAEPIVTVVFARGHFDDRAVELTGIAVVGYAIALGGLAVREVAARVFLAVGDSRTPAVVAVVAMAANVAGDLTLGVRYGVAGLAASTSLSLLIAAGLLCGLAVYRHQAMAGAVLVRSTGGALAAAVAGAAAARAVLTVVPADGTGDAVLALLASGGACLAVYVMALVVLRVPAVADQRQVLKDLLGRRPPPSR